MSGNSLHDGKEISGALRESLDSRLRQSHDCTSSPEAEGESAPESRRSIGTDGRTVGQGMLAVLTSSDWLVETGSLDAERFASLFNQTA